GAAARVDVHDPVLTGEEIVHVEDGRGSHLPVTRLEAGVAVEQLERDEEVLLDAELLALAEEAGAVRARAADVARHRQPAPFDEGVAAQRGDQEGVLADDRVVALEDILSVGIPPAAARLGGLVRRVRIAVIRRDARTPTVRQRDLLIAGYRVGRTTET